MRLAFSQSYATLGHDGLGHIAAVTLPSVRTEAVMKRFESVADDHELESDELD